MNKGVAVETIRWTQDLMEVEAAALRDGLEMEVTGRLGGSVR